MRGEPLAIIGGNNMTKYIFAYIDNYKKTHFFQAKTYQELVIRKTNHKHMGHEYKLYKEVNESCEYCKNNKLMQLGGDTISATASVDSDSKEVLIDFYDQNGNNYQQWFTALYCPLCGGKL